MLNSIRRESRFDLLLRQYKQGNIRMTDEVEQSLDRFCLFLYHHTDVHYFSFVNEKVLRAYITHHRSNNFDFISFAQVIKDVNHFLAFLRIHK